MYRKLAKCYCENILNNPNLKSQSNVNPFRKYVENIMLININIFTKRIDKFGGQ